MGMPERLFIAQFMVSPGMLEPADFPPQNPETEYINVNCVMDFVNTVRRFVNPRKGDAFCSRSELMQKLNELQKLME